MRQQPHMGGKHVRVPSLHGEPIWPCLRPLKKKKISTIFFHLHTWLETFIFFCFLFLDSPSPYSQLAHPQRQLFNSLFESLSHLCKGWFFLALLSFDNTVYLSMQPSDTTCCFGTIRLGSCRFFSWKSTSMPLGPIPMGYPINRNWKLNGIILTWVIPCWLLMGVEQLLVYPMAFGNLLRRKKKKKNNSSWWLLFCLTSSKLLSGAS